MVRKVDIDTNIDMVGFLDVFRHIVFCIKDSCVSEAISKVLAFIIILVVRNMPDDDGKRIL